jgi:D-amino-acid dehydrogenase
MRVAVIGGGVVGVCTAYFLAETGHEVTVLERYGNVAQEASFGNLDLMGPASVRPWSMPGTVRRVLGMLMRPESPMAFSAKFEPAMWGWLRRLSAECDIQRFKQNQSRLHRLASYSHELMLHLAQIHELDSQQRTGVMMMFRTARDLDQAHPMMETLGDAGVRTELLDPDGAAQLEPTLSTQTPFQGALFMPDDWSGNCPLFVRQLKAIAQERGVEFQFNCEVDAIQPELGGVSYRVGDKIVDVDAIVIAAGAESGKLLRNIGISLPMYPVKVYSASTQIQEYDLAPNVSLYDDTYRIALTRLGKRIRIAGCAELGSSNFDLHQKAIDTLVKVADDWFPNAANYRTATFWCGPTAMLPEGVPLVGSTTHNNVFVNAGHGASAWALAAGSGKLVADLVSGRRTEIDTDGLTLTRYGDRVR